MSSYRKTMRQVREEMLVISEAKYELYHKDFSTAMQHAYKMAKKLHGITVDPKEIDDKVASGPRKPSEGKTNSYRLEGDKGSIQVQVYNKGGPKPFELNFYKEEVDLDEAEDFKPHKMYDPETGEAHDAKTMEDHLRMKKMGYSHDKPKSKDEGAINEILPALAGMAVRYVAKKGYNAIKGKDKKKPKVDSAPNAPATESAASDARRAMAADPSTKQTFSKNVSATDDDVKAADKNIMMQMRKAVSLRGNKVEFMDKKKVEIPQKVAQAVLDKYNSQKKPADKEKFQTKVSKSYKSMLTALKEQNEINSKNKSLHELKSLVREMKGNNNG